MHSTTLIVPVVAATQAVIVSPAVLSTARVSETCSIVDHSAPECCHCGSRGYHSPNCPFRWTILVYHSGHFCESLVFFGWWVKKLTLLSNRLSQWPLLTYHHQQFLSQYVLSLRSSLFNTTPTFVASSWWIMERERMDTNVSVLEPNNVLVYHRHRILYALLVM